MQKNTARYETLKSVWWSALYDVGLTYVSSVPIPGAEYFQVPFDFGLYPSDWSEDPDTFDCVDLFGSDLLVAMSFNPTVQSPVPEATVLRLKSDSPTSDVADMDVDSTDSPSGSSKMKYTEAEMEWASNVNSLDSMLSDFGNRKVTLFMQVLKYGKAQWMQMTAPSQNSRLQLPDPGDGHIILYRARLANWADNGDLRCDSQLSFYECVVRMIYYSHYHDFGLSCPEFGPIPKAQYYLVPPEFDLYPPVTEEDSGCTIESLIGRQLYKEITTYDSPSSPKPSKPTNPTANVPARPAASLRQSSYGQPVLNLAEQKSLLQNLLARRSDSDEAVNFTNPDDSFLATAFFQPEPGIHPVSNMIEGSKIILASGRAVDPSFELRCLHEELQEENPPLTTIDDPKYPNDYKTVKPYMEAPSWQLILVKPGQKDQNGRQKEQPTIYSTIRISSKFQPEIIISYLKPDLI